MMTKEERVIKRLELVRMIKDMGNMLEQQVLGNPQSFTCNNRVAQISKPEVIMNQCRNMRLYLNELRKLYEPRDEHGEWIR